ncbi:MAG: hypothetical protein ACYCVH_14060 [Ignavibacteriaceae bacterium]
MKKLIILAAIFVLVIECNLFAQENFSLQLNGGILSPINNSSQGLLGSVQLNYNYNTNIYFYLYTGLGSWDRTYFSYWDKKHYISQIGYSEDKHKMTPVYAGVRIYINRNKIVNLFVDGEIGIVFLNYNKYDQQKFVNPDGQIEYLPVSHSKESEDLLGLGAGVGVSHNLGTKFILLLELKLNSIANSNYSSLFGVAGASTTIQFGFSFNI